MKNIVVWSAIVIGILLSVNLARSVYDISRRESVLSQAKEELSQAHEENNRLIDELEYVQSPAYIEKQARDKLNMARSGETVVIIPDITPPSDENNDVKVPVWRQWAEVFGFSG